MATVEPQIERSYNDTTGSGVSDIKKVIRKVLAACEGVLPSFNIKGRRTKVIDQMFEKEYQSYATRVNKKREAAALAQGRAKYDKVFQMDAVKGVHRGDPEFSSVVSPWDTINFVNKVLREMKLNDYLSPDECEAVMTAMVIRYASHPDAQEFITVDSIDRAKLALLAEADEDDDEDEDQPSVGASAPVIPETSATRNGEPAKV